MAGRRGNNEGSIVKRSDGRWMARVSLGDGTRKAFYGKTRQEVARRLAEAQRAVDSGLPLLDERQTLGHYLDAWIETVRSQIRPSSWRRYHDCVGCHLRPGLGTIPLAKLSPQHLQAFYNRKLTEGLSSTTVHLLHGVLHRALADALRMGLVQRNVTELVRAPRQRTRDMVTFSDAQAREFLRLVGGDRFEALYVLALTTGMRESELLALRWHDVDLDRAKVTIRGSVQEVDGKFIIAEPKTATSRRTIALTSRAVEALRNHRAQQHEERLMLGHAWDNALNLVFPDTIGGIMSRHHLTARRFKPVAAKLGVPHMRFHDLRHTAATLLLSRGVHPKVVSEMLGHTDISITLRVYAHVTPDMQCAAVQVMESLLGLG